MLLSRCVYDASVQYICTGFPNVREKAQTMRLRAFHAKPSYLLFLPAASTLVLLLLHLSHLARNPVYIITDLGRFGCPSKIPIALNASCEIVRVTGVGRADNH